MQALPHSHGIQRCMHFSTATTHTQMQRLSHQQCTKKGTIDGPPKIPLRLTPRAPEVTRTQNSAKNENATFGISTSRGFRNVIVCHVFGEKNDRFRCSKKNSAPLAPEFIMIEKQSCHRSPFPEPPTPLSFGRLYRPPPCPPRS